MKQDINIAILDTDNYFIQGLEVLLTLYFRHKGKVLTFLPKEDYAQADILFQQDRTVHNMRPCRRKTVLQQHIITLQSTNQFRAPACLAQLNAVSRRMSKEALLLEIERILAHQAPKHKPRDCPHCSQELTLRQSQVLLGISKGMSLSQIAESLTLNIKTISSHKLAAMRKLGFTRNSELYHWLRQRGLEYEMGWLV